MNNQPIYKTYPSSMNQNRALMDYIELYRGYIIKRGYSQTFWKIEGFTSAYGSAEAAKRVIDKLCDKNK